MAEFQYGPQEKNLGQITSADTVKIEFCLFDATAPSTVKTGVAFGDVTVMVCKPGATAFAAWPAVPGWGTGNWQELGNGWYQIILTGSVVAELALLDTTGPIKFHIAGTGIAHPPISRTIVANTNIQAVARTLLALPAAAPDAATGLPVSDAGGLDLDTLLNRLDAMGSSRGTADPGDQMDLVNAPNATAVTAIQGAAVYQASIEMIDDDENDDENDADRYVVSWFKNSEPVESGITLPTIRVVKTDGTDLFAAATMTQIGTTGAYYYNQVTAASRVVDGAVYLRIAQATIDGETREWRRGGGRDS